VISPEPDYEDVTPENGAWCEMSPPHDGRWIIFTGRSEHYEQGEMGCDEHDAPIVYMLCNYHVELFFVAWSRL
jgi:hypothetical protein